MSAPDASTLSVSLFSTIAQVSSVFSPTFLFTSTNTIAQDDVLKISILSTNVSLVSSASITIIVTDVNNYTDIVSQNTTQTNLSNSVYGYIIPKITWKGYISTGLSVYISGMSFRAPFNNQTIQAFRLSLFRNGSMYCSGVVSLTPDVSPLTNATVTADNPLVNGNTQYSVTFTTSSPLSSKGWLQIVLPYEIATTTYSAQRCVNAIGSNVSTSAMCAMSNGTLTVTNLFTGSISASSQITVKFTGVTNPGSAKPSSTFKITSFYD